MIELIIWLAVILLFSLSSLKKSGKLDEITGRAAKRKQNKEDNVVYEQPQEGAPGKKPGKARDGWKPQKAAKGVGLVLMVLVILFLGMGSYYTLSEQEMAVITTFGSPSVVESSGLHFKIPLIQKITKVSKAITGMQIGYTTDPERAAGASTEYPVSL